jgi:hypothetical protein
MCSKQTQVSNLGNKLPETFTPSIFSFGPCNSPPLARVSVRGFKTRRRRCHLDIEFRCSPCGMIRLPCGVNLIDSVMRKALSKTLATVCRRTIFVLPSTPHGHRKKRKACISSECSSDGFQWRDRDPMAASITVSSNSRGKAGSTSRLIVSATRTSRRVWISALNLSTSETASFLPSSAGATLASPAVSCDVLYSSTWLFK